MHILLLDREPLYRGALTDIYHGLYRGEEVALKRLRVFHHQRDSDQQRLRRKLAKEARIWHQLDHPNVLHFLCVDSDTFPGDACVVSPWMRHGTIIRYRKTYGPSNVNLHRRLFEICQGISYLHKCGVVHGDLRGTNILVDSQGNACLADFGLTDFIEELGQASASHYQGSTRWLAPELIHPDDFGLSTFQKTGATDIYAFAFLCLEVYTGRLPFIDIANDAEVIFQVIQGGRPRRPTAYDGQGVEIGDDLWELIQRCWEHQLLDRPSIDDILQTFEIWNRGWTRQTIQNVKNAVADWIFDNHGQHLCWVQNAGSPRTTYISSAIAELCAQEGRLAASIFFTSSGPNPVTFFPKVAEQLAHHYPSIDPLIRDAFRQDPSMLNPSSTDELQNLLMKTIVEPVLSLGGNVPRKVVVVDSLDLCEEGYEMEGSWLTVEILIQAVVWLAEALSRAHAPLQFFVSSLPELHRRAKRNLPKFHTDVRSLYFHDSGILDSLADGWKELARLSAPSVTTTYNPAPDTPATAAPESLIFAPDGIVSHIARWTEDHAGRKVCWLKYPVCQYGRSSFIAQYVSEQCANRGALAARIVASDEGINSRTLLPSIAYQIGQAMPILRGTLRQIIEDEREVLLETDSQSFARKVIIEPFLVGDVHMISSMVIVFDCIGWSGGDLLLQTIVWLAEELRSHAIPLQIFVASEQEMFSKANIQHQAFMDRALTLHLPRFESWTSTPLTSTRSLFVNNTNQKIYQKLTSFLDATISAEHTSDQRLCNTFQAYLDHMANLDVIQSLVESHRSRLQLLQLSNQMQIAEHPSIRECLQEDENAIANILEGIFLSGVDVESMLNLRGDAAHSCLNLLQNVLSKGQLTNYEAVRKAKRLLIKLSEASEIIPASVLIHGLTLIESTPVSGGGFADIYRAMYRGQEVALKHLRVRQDQDSQRIRREFGREALVWQHLKHPNVLPFLGIDSEVFPSSLCMVSPWMRHGTILDLRAANGPSNINLEKRLVEIGEGLEYLHSEGIIHGDLRGANILVDNDWHAVLADFGLTVFGDATMTAATHTDNPHGSLRWMAPELLNPEMFDMDRFVKTRASDVYSFSCVVLELYSGHHPFVEAANDAAVMYRIMQGRRPALRSGAPAEDSELIMPDYAAEVVEWCWKQEPPERPDIMDVVQIMKSWEGMATADAMT